MSTSQCTTMRPSLPSSRHTARPHGYRASIALGGASAELGGSTASAARSLGPTGAPGATSGTTTSSTTMDVLCPHTSTDVLMIVLSSL